jgi:hypothetical protein
MTCSTSCYLCHTLVDPCNVYTYVFGWKTYEKIHNTSVTLASNVDTFRAWHLLHKILRRLYYTRTTVRLSNAGLGGIRICYLSLEHSSVRLPVAIFHHLYKQNELPVRRAVQILFRYRQRTIYSYTAYIFIYSRSFTSTC